MENHQSDTHIACRPRQTAQVLSSITSTHDDDDDSIVSFRYNGRCFHIQTSPSFLHDSPATTAKYIAYISALKRCSAEGDTDSQGEQNELDFYHWIAEVSIPLFLEKAQNKLPSFDPDQIRSGAARPVLSDYLFPQSFGCRLEAFNDKISVRHIDDHGGLIRPGSFLSHDILDNLEHWTVLIDPSCVQVIFKHPDDALSKTPSTVAIDLDGSGHEIPCFFKAFATDAPGGPLTAELEAYKKIQAKLGSDVRVCRLLGVVHERSGGVTQGLLLQLIEGARTLSERIYDDADATAKDRWIMQIRETLMKLHGAGVIWGDAKAENVLVDKDNNAWITDFGGSYTRGCVDADIAGTEEGDLQGLERIISFIRGTKSNPE